MRSYVQGWKGKKSEVRGQITALDFEIVVRSIERGSIEFYFLRAFASISGRYFSMVCRLISKGTGAAGGRRER